MGLAARLANKEARKDMVIIDKILRFTIFPSFILQSDSNHYYEIIMMKEFPLNQKINQPEDVLAEANENLYILLLFIQHSPFYNLQQYQAWMGIKDTSKCNCSGCLYQSIGHII